MGAVEPEGGELQQAWVLVIAVRPVVAGVPSGAIGLRRSSLAGHAKWV